MNASESVLSLEVGTIVTCKPAGNVRLSTFISGKTLKSLKPKLKLPHLSKDFSFSPAKSLTLGSTK